MLLKIFPASQPASAPPSYLLFTTPHSYTSKLTQRPHGKQGWGPVRVHTPPWHCATLIYSNYAQSAKKDVSQQLPIMSMFVCDPIEFYRSRKPSLCAGMDGHLVETPVVIPMLKKETSVLNSGQFHQLHCCNTLQRSPAAKNKSSSVWGDGGCASAVWAPSGCEVKASLGYISGPKWNVSSRKHEDNSLDLQHPCESPGGGASQLLGGGGGDSRIWELIC